MSRLVAFLTAVLLLAVSHPVPVLAQPKAGKSEFRNAASRPAAKAAKRPGTKAVAAKSDAARSGVPTGRAGRPLAGRAAKQAARAGGRTPVAVTVRGGAGAGAAAVATLAVPAAMVGTEAAGVGSAGVGTAGVEAAVERIAPMSLGAVLGLHRTNDPLELRSASALVIERRTGKVLFEKNPQYVLPIASLTKLMTAMVVLDAGQPLDEVIEVASEDRDTDRFSASHLPVGARASRAELLQLALMASENRAAAALARTYPGGLTAYVEAANRKAASLGMVDSVFADGTGLSASNVATVHDLARMVSAASGYPEIARWSLASSLSLRLGQGSRNFHTTNRLVGSANWQLELQKTGYISEAGNCLLLQARVDERSLIVVLLDSAGRYSRIGDAERIRRWLEKPA